MKDSLKIALGTVIGILALCGLVAVCMLGISMIGTRTTTTPTVMPTAKIGDTIYGIGNGNLSITLMAWRESTIVIEGPYNPEYYAFTAKPGMKFAILVYKFKNEGVRAQETPYLNAGEVKTNQGFFYSVWHSPAGVDSDEYKPRKATEDEIKELIGNSAGFINLLPQQESPSGRVAFEIPKDASPIQATLRGIPALLQFSGNPSPLTAWAAAPNESVPRGSRHGLNGPFHLNAAQRAAASLAEHRAALNMLVKAGLAKQVDKCYYLDRARVNALKQ